MQLLRGANKCSDSALAREVLDGVPPVIWFIRRHMRQHRHSLSVPQFRALVHISHQPCISLSSVAEHMGESMPTISRLVTGLVDKGLLSRNGSHVDRRQVCLAITAAGRGLLQTAWSQTQGEIQQRLCDLSAVEKDHLVQGMTTLKRLFGSLGLSESAQASSKPAARRRSKAASK